MRRLFLALALAVLGGAAQAQEVLAPDPGIENTIQSQLDAFLADDIAGAWQFASPTIRGLFGTPENFGRMVRQGYPMVWRPGQVAFLDLQTFAGLIVQRVQITDRQGRPHVLGYLMTETESGWQISGVQILPAPEVGA